MQVEIFNDTYWIRSSGKKLRINGRLLNEYELRKKIDNNSWFQYANVFSKTIKEIVKDLEDQYYTYVGYEEEEDDYDFEE